MLNTRVLQNLRIFVLTKLELFIGFNKYLRGTSFITFVLHIATNKPSGLPKSLILKISSVVSFSQPLQKSEHAMFYTCLTKCFKGSVFTNETHFLPFCAFESSRYRLLIYTKENLIQLKTRSSRYIFSAALKLPSADLTALYSVYNEICIYICTRLKIGIIQL